VKIGQTVKLYKFRKQSKRNPYRLLGEFLYQGKTPNFITLKYVKGYTESVSIVDLRLRRYKITIDGQEYKIAPIKNTMEIERKHKDIELQEYRQTVGKKSYESMMYNNRKRRKERREKTNAS